MKPDIEWGDLYHWRVGPFILTLPIQFKKGGLVIVWPIAWAPE